ncbi:HAD-IA family hydrolase [Candidatus Woesearchaeota archaeon]|nr:HAD-IA family hydrolase [Candidatus Woesearchaeota archaeon]
MKSLLCFDLDNTLIDSSKTHILSYNAAFKKMNLPKKSAKEINSLLGMQKKEMIRILQPNIKNIKKIADLHSYYLQKKYYKYTKTLPYVKSTLKKLKKNYFIAIASNISNKKNLICLLKNVKLTDNYFDVIVTANQVKHPKPNPEEIYLAEKIIKAKTKYVIGDSIYDILTARNAKTKSIIILECSNTPLKELKRLRPTYILKSFKGLRDIL